MKGKIDYKKHMKANVGRNLTEAFDLHEILMVLVMRMSARKIKRSTIASEDKVQNSEDIADISIDLKKHPVYYELQTAISNEWINKIVQRDIETGTETLIIDLNKFKKYEPMLKELKQDLEAFILEEK